MTDELRGHREVRRVLFCILACFFLSGATGLIYEVLWIRALGLVFGHTVFAITTVLTAFMAGLGLGSFLFGRLADRRRDLLRLYGILEGGIGLYCLGIPLLLSTVEAIHLVLYRSLHLSFYAFSLAQFGLTFLILVVPTTLMGATLPILSRFFVREEATLGRRVGLLYALNTLGAVLGAALAGYFLLPSFGMRGTLYLAATLNIGLAALVIVYDRHLRRLREQGFWNEEAIPPQSMPERAGSRRALGGVIGLTVIGLGLSGAASMVYEVAWSRALSLIIGSSTYAFTAMLVVFLVGIALGSYLFSQLWGERPVAPFTFGVIELGIGLTALLILPAFGKMPELFLGAMAISDSPGFVLIVQLLLSFVAMIVPTLLIGATLPCAVRIAARGVSQVGSDVGSIYAVNTLGAIVGTLLAGFVLIPAVGVQVTVKLAVLLNILVGAAILLVSFHAVASWRRGASLALSLVAFAAVYWVPSWDKRVMASGVAIYTRSYLDFAGKLELSRAFPRQHLLFYEDGLTATVTVHQTGDFRSLQVNGKTDASNGIDMYTQLMSGHLPLLLHPNPKSVLIIGLGAGVTVGAVAQHPVERIDVVEIEPAVARASEFFARENRNALRDPRVHLVIADGRNFLLSTQKRYDVIISEPSNPWIRGVATLFSEESYKLAKQRLNPDGIMLQWIQGYSFFPADLRMVVKTFRTAFPAVTVWNTLLSDYFLIGRDRPVAMDLEALKRRYDALPGLREDMARLGQRSAYALLADFLLSEPDTIRYSRTASVNTDDYLPLEFSAPRSLYLDTDELNFRLMKSYQTREFPLAASDGLARLDHPDVRFHLGLAYLQKGHLTQAATQFTKALRRNPNSVPTLLELGKVQLRQNRVLKAIETFHTALRHDPRNAEASFQLGSAYQKQRMPSNALTHLSKAVAYKPHDPTYRGRLAALLNDQGRHSEALEQYLIARQEDPEDLFLLDGLGALHLHQGMSEPAIQLYRKAISVEPRSPHFHLQLGKAYVLAKRYPEAVAALERATYYNPLLVDAYVELGRALLSAGEADKAADAFEQALRLDPRRVEVVHQLELAFPPSSE